MIKKIALLCLFELFIFKAVSINPKIIDTLEIHKQIKVFNIDEDILNFKSNFFCSIVFKNDSTLYYNPNGTLHLFKISLGENTIVSKISNSVYGGHNFDRELFIHNNIVYSYGGKGLFNTYPRLSYFDSSLSGWLEKDIKNYPFDAREVMNSWKFGNKVMVLLNHFSESIFNKTDEIYQFSFGEFDLTNFEYIQHFTFESRDTDLGLIKGNYFYDSELYSIVGTYEDKGRIGYRVFNKKEGSLIRTSKLDGLERVDGFSYVYIKDSTVFYRSYEGEISSFNVNAGTKINTKYFLKQYKGRANDSFGYKVFLIIISLVLVIGACYRESLIYKLRKKNKLSENKLSDNKIKDTLYIQEKLMKYKNSIITKEELDELLNISHYSYETIKTRRSMMINQINQDGKMMITRVRQKDDKRFYDYNISIK